MKRSLTLLLASLLLVFSLTACGRNDKQQDTNQNDSAVTNSDNNQGAASDKTDQNDSQNNTNQNTTGQNDTNHNGDSVMDDVGNAITDGVDDVADGIEDVGDAITGDNAKSGTVNRTRSTANGMF